MESRIDLYNLLTGEHPLKKIPTIDALDKTTFKSGTISGTISGENSFDRAMVSNGAYANITLEDIIDYVVPPVDPAKVQIWVSINWFFRCCNQIRTNVRRFNKLLTFIVIRGLCYWPRNQLENRIVLVLRAAQPAPVRKTSF